jgi:uncharacterized membrane protein YkoI
MRWLAFVTAFAVALGTTAAPGVGHAAQRDRVRHMAESAELQPLGAVLKAIARRYPGRALDARRVERDGRPLYQIKWLGQDGKVRDITADARTGQILQVR